MTRKLDPNTTERRCFACHQVKDLEAFPRALAKTLGRDYRCKACWSEYRRSGPNPKVKAWSDTEMLRIEQHYPTMGAAGMLKAGYLADRTRDAINRQARLMGVRVIKAAAPIDTAEPSWPLPAHDYTDPDIAARKWANDYATPGPLVPAIGRAA